MVGKAEVVRRLPNPDRLRANSLRCAQLAEDVSNAQLKVIYEQMSKTYGNLAREVEHSLSLQETLRKIR